MANSDLERDLEWVAERVDAYIDGDLPVADAARLESLVAQHSACAEELALARKVTEALHTMPSLRAPEAVTTAVARETRESSGLPSGNLQKYFWSAASLAAALVLVVAVFRFDTPAKPAAPPPVTLAAPSPSYTPEEIEAAETELRWTFAYLSAMADRSAQVMQTEVFGRPLARPMREVAQFVIGPRENSGATAPASGDEQ